MHEVSSVKNVGRRKRNAYPMCTVCVYYIVGTRDSHDSPVATTTIIVSLVIKSTNTAFPTHFCKTCAIASLLITEAKHPCKPLPFPITKSLVQKYRNAWTFTIPIKPTSPLTISELSSRKSKTSSPTWSATLKVYWNAERKLSCSWTKPTDSISKLFDSKAVVAI